MYNLLDSSKREFRLLRLLAGDKTDDIDCELYTASLDIPDEFEALSYVWGSRKHVRLITIQQEAKPVTENLESALRHLRHPDRPRTLWVDAVCINQDDLQEKTSQIAEMGSIYSQASQVLVWFGPEENYDLEAITAIRKLAADDELHWTDSELALNPMALCLFLENRWWSRVWTVQETVLAKRITYQSGSRLLADSEMLGMEASYRTHTSERQCCNIDSAWERERHVDIFNDLVVLIRRLPNLSLLQEYVRKGKVPFDEVASEFRTRRATDLRDKVYGLLSISRGVRTASINYSLTVAQVFEATTRELLVYRENLNILSHCGNLSGRYGIAGRITPGLPSWAPDWGAQEFPPDNEFALIVYRIPFVDAYSACGQLRYVASNSDEEGILGLSGILCDRIEKVGSNIRQARELLGDVLYAWRGMVGVDRDPGRSYVAGDTISEAFWRTLCLDISAASAASAERSSKRDRAGPEDRWVHMGFWYRELLSLYQLPRPDAVPGITKLFLFKQHVKKTTARRRFFVSKKGYIGLAPLDTQVGDTICVFAGGKVPFIVRDLGWDERDQNVSEPESQHCHLLGAAYVHGLMDGEAVDMLEKGVGRLETFKLH